MKMNFFTSCPYQQTQTVNTASKRILINRGKASHRGVGRVPEEANHLGLGSRADQSHVAVPEGAVDLQVEAGLGRRVAVLSESLHPVSRQVEAKAVGPDLRGRHLRFRGKEAQG